MTRYTYNAETRDALIDALERAAHLLRWESENAVRDTLYKHAESLEGAAKRCDDALAAMDKEDAERWAIPPELAGIPVSNVIPWHRPNRAPTSGDAA